MINVQKKFRELITPAFEIARVSQNVIGPQAAQSDVICGSILVSKFRDGLQIVEVTPTGAIEYLTSDLPFLCLGSGKQNADPFLGFLWSVYFGNNQVPSLNEGSLLAYWTISNAIKLASAGVGLGIDVFSMRSDTGLVEHYTSEALIEHDGLIKEVEGAMRTVRVTLAGNGAAPPPSPPA